MPPRRSPKVHPLRWVLSDTGGRPDWVRWVWHPRSGETRIGRVIHHYELLGKQRTQLSDWVRGFYFPKPRLLVVRTYFAPKDPLDDFNAAYRELDERVSEQIVFLLGQHLRDARFATGVDNNWLENRFPRLCQW